MNNKTSDKNVGGIEDDIKILENLKSYLNLLIYEGNDKIIYNDLLWDEKTVDCIYAMENLINDYTRQKQLNEEHRKLNGELRERVKELERNSNCDSVYAIKFATMQQQINEKDKRIQELEEELAEFNKQLDLDYVDKNYIPKQVVIESLEDIEDYFDRLNGPDEDIEYIRQVKNELLEGER